jgi:hypothetical protein
VIFFRSYLLNVSILQYEREIEYFVHILFYNKRTVSHGGETRRFKSGETGRLKSVESKSLRHENARDKRKRKREKEKQFV